MPNVSRSSAHVPSSADSRAKHRERQRAEDVGAAGSATAHGCVEVNVNVLCSVSDHGSCLAPLTWFCCVRRTGHSFP
eukprot:6234282-Prymnesium_polylepis.1